MRIGKRWSVGCKIFVAAILTHALMVLGMPRATVWSAWEEDWNKTLAEARREGQVNVYLSYDALLPHFQKEHPEIKVVGVIGRGNDLTQRLISERRAEKYIADVISTGPRPAEFYQAKIYDPLRPALILPEVVDQSKWWTGRHIYADPSQELAFIYIGVIQAGSVSYNTKLANAKEFKSLWDILNPRWKGKIEARDIRSPGPGSGAMRFFYHNPELGPNFVRRFFTEMDVTLFRDFRQGADGLANGKFALCIGCVEIAVLQQKGLPVENLGVMKEGAGIVSNSGTVGLVNKAPHPNAAKVFINWLLSRKGQMALQNELANTDDAVDSLRVDIPKDMVPLRARRIEGVKYLLLDTRPEYQEMQPIIKLMEESLAEAKKK
jgi:iron(III) transport system substrate-binding protein